MGCCYTVFVIIQVLVLGSHFLSNWCKLLFVSWSMLEYVSVHFALPCYYSVAIATQLTLSWE